MLGSRTSIASRQWAAAPAPLSRGAATAVPLQSRRRRPGAVARSCKDNVAALAPIDSVAEVVINLPDGGVWAVPNKPGKAASARIFAHLAAAHGGRLTPAAAEEALRLYDEYTAEAREKPGSHPNIDLCFRVIAEGLQLPISVKQL
ncbi:hypothetical protein Rsub_08635 [Raphidocelis subcapitata]|uniref:Uncharacterized protein n=1 Tax=Raphidocelis subcapitata TaxID=307507 RepID=A0A2V0PCM0_9CHLO|nr:hypothetical protein Rsub_08635 [Raphidocelis subcapitata]|eukprot:GBF95653.1 hypothetical protein Rsub_08635 [Raphidocelis subcapitata]